MTTPTSPRRSWFAVWRWKWLTWAAVGPLLVFVYVASAPLGLYVANQFLRTNSTVLWWLHDAVWCFYHPVMMCRAWCDPLNDFLDWEYRKIALFFDPNDF